MKSREKAGYLQPGTYTGNESRERREMAWLQVLALQQAEVRKPEEDPAMETTRAIHGLS